MITYGFIALLIAIVVWRVILPGMKMESEEVKVGKPVVTKATGAGVPPTPSASMKEWFEKYVYVWAILLVLVGFLVFWGLWGSIVGGITGVTFAGMMKLAVPFAIVVAAVLILSYIFDGDRGAQVRKGMWAAVVAFIVVGSLLLYQDWDTVGWFSEKSKKVPTLSMPANGDSSQLPARPGHPVAFTGSGFTTHCVYSDGSEGVVGSLTNPCKDGPMLYQYVRDTSGKPNKVTYEYLN